jgi:hypothetical protein
MKEETKKRLKDKGWEDEELIKAETELEELSKHDVHFSKIVFWSALVVIIFANFVVSMVLIPFLVALQQIYIYFFIAVLGGVIGFLYNFLITDIGHLEKKHHIAAGIIIPVLAIINVIIVVLAANNFITELKVQNSLHSPWLIASIFAGSFILPYLISKIFGKK